MPIPHQKTDNSIGRRLLKDEVFDRLLEAIMSGHFKPGERLNDKEISEWLQVSRTPVISAFEKLSQLGIVEISANRHTRLVQISEKSIRDHIEMTGLLASTAMRMAVPKLDSKAQNELLNLIDEVIQCLVDDDFGRLYETTRACFEFVYTQTNNDVFIEWVHQVQVKQSYVLRQFEMAGLDRFKLLDGYGALRMAITNLQTTAATDAVLQIHALNQTT